MSRSRRRHVRSPLCSLVNDQGHRIDIRQPSVAQRLLEQQEQLRLLRADLGQTRRALAAISESEAGFRRQLDWLLRRRLVQLLVRLRLLQVVAPAIFRELEPIPGLCRICGCTDQRSCPGGCGWADDSHTLCTICAPPK
jgi:hypothetical protein